MLNNEKILFFPSEKLRKIAPSWTATQEKIAQMEKDGWTVQQMLEWAGRPRYI